MTDEEKQRWLVAVLRALTSYSPTIGPTQASDMLRRHKDWLVEHAGWPAGWVAAKVLHKEGLIR